MKTHLSQEGVNQKVGGIMQRIKSRVVANRPELLLIGPWVVGAMCVMAVVYATYLLVRMIFS